MLAAPMRIWTAHHTVSDHYFAELQGQGHARRLGVEDHYPGMHMK